MKKIFICVICKIASLTLAMTFLCNLCASFSFSETLDFGKLIDELKKTSVEPLAKDVGAVLGGGMFHSGRTLALVPGIDVGFSASAAMQPSDDDIILKNAIGKKPFGLPYIQLSKGLPYSFDITLRGFPESQGLKLLGAGLKYGIIEKEIAVVKLGLSAMYSYNQLHHSDFKATTNSFAGIFSVKIPVIEPYLGVAIDSTKLETDFSVAELGVKTNVDVNVSEPRYVLGLNFSLLPFTYINVAGTYSVDHYGVDFGLGLKF
ncbi:MAG: hypothetical protein HY919_00960 [Elusimicrobia bacterium]|nr:hypothetical protein [Elusimicrobiota bacterium]